VLRILFDVTALMRPDLTGIGVYAKNLFARIGARDDVAVRGCWKLDRYRRRGFLPLHVAGEVGPYIPFLTDLNLGGWQIFHGPDFRIPKRGRYRKVVTIHDLVIREPDLVDERFAREGIEKMERTLLRCNPARIITVSEFTRSRLLEYYPSLEPITRAIPLGVDLAKFADPAHADTARSTPAHTEAEHSAPTRSGLPPELDGRPYLLSVGSVEKRKNLVNTIAAFELSRRAHPDLRLLVAGGGGHGADEIEAAIARSPAAGSIVRLGFVDDALLAALYRNAACFVYPSLYEGFGLPVLEAMAAGAPVVTSNRGALAEVAGTAALTADPLDPASIAAAVLTILDSPERRATLISAAHARAAAHTWQRTTDATMEVYREAMG
jgi:glycosyltransferase involved in cell wall biosynthesis